MTDTEVSINNSDNEPINEKKVWCYTITLGIIIPIIILIIVIPTILSFGYINYTQCGFVQDIYGVVDTSKVLPYGRYLIGPTKKIITFDALYNHVDLITQVFTDDGYQITIEISFWYKINSNTLAQTYNTYSTNYPYRILSIAQSLIKNNVTGYKIHDYIQRRENIEYSLGTLLQNKLFNDVFVDVPKRYFRILSIKADALFANSLISAIQQQNNSIQQNQQLVSVINADTIQMVAEINANANLILEYADTEAKQIVQISQNTLINKINEARSDGIELIIKTLNISNPTIKDELIKILAYIDANSTQIVPLGNNIILNI
jgi:hypothetical protein